MNIRKLLVVTTLIVIGVFIGLRIPVVQDMLLDNVIKSTFQTSNLPKTDALSAIVCGSRSPLPHSSRDETCILVIAGEDIYVVDAGAGSANNARLWRIPFNKIKGVLLTHLHSDHITDLPGFHLATWIPQRPTKLRVYGPQGVDEVVKGFERAYSADYFFRNAHHGDEIASLKVAGMLSNVVSLENPKIIETENLTVTAFRVEHDPVKPALGYRFDYKGRSIVISGDTIPSQSLIDNSMGADVLFHEAQANHILQPMKENMLKMGNEDAAKILEDITTYHTTPEEAAEVANKANIKHLVLYHLTPAPRNAIMESIFVRGVDKIRKEWTLSDDGTVVVLPIDSTEIQIYNIN